MRQETHPAGPTTETDFNYNAFYDHLLLGVCTSYYLQSYVNHECMYCLLSNEKCVVCGLCGFIRNTYPRYRAELRIEILHFKSQ